MILSRSPPADAPPFLPRLTASARSPTAPLGGLCRGGKGQPTTSADRLLACLAASRLAQPIKPHSVVMKEFPSIFEAAIGHDFV